MRKSTVVEVVETEGVVVLKMWTRMGDCRLGVPVLYVHLTWNVLRPVVGPKCRLLSVWT